MSDVNDGSGLPVFGASSLLVLESPEKAILRALSYSLFLGHRFGTAFEWWKKLHSDILPPPVEQTIHFCASAFSEFLVLSNLNLCDRQWGLIST